MMIVITGASDGIGEALARKLSKSDKVVMLARNEEKLKKIAEQSGAEYFVCDVREAESVKKVFEEIIEKYGVIDVLINNAGIIVNGDLTETPDESIENVMSTNSTGAIYVAKYTLKSMKKAKAGLIINVVSQAGVKAGANRSVYNASKWAMTGFTKAIQEEVAEYGVRYRILPRHN
jgi:short-subunit dehydrogenase